MVKQKRKVGLIYELLAHWAYFFPFIPLSHKLGNTLFYTNKAGNKVSYINAWNIPWIHGAFQGNVIPVIEKSIIFFEPVHAFKAGKNPSAHLFFIRKPEFIRTEAGQKIKPDVCGRGHVWHFSFWVKGYIIRRKIVCFLRYIFTEKLPHITAVSHKCVFIFFGNMPFTACFPFSRMIREHGHKQPHKRKQFQNSRRRKHKEKCTAQGVYKILFYIA